jgi:hypothetical protein
MLFDNRIAPLFAGKPPVVEESPQNLQAGFSRCAGEQ